MEKKEKDGKGEIMPYHLSGAFGTYGHGSSFHKLQ